MLLATKSPRVVEYLFDGFWLGRACIALDSADGDCEDALTYYHEHFGGPVPVRQLVFHGPGQSLLEALRHLHHVGIAHLDVKAPNLLWWKRGGVEDPASDVYKICDLELAKHMGLGALTFDSRSTPLYAPPVGVGAEFSGSAFDVYCAGFTLLTLFGFACEVGRDVVDLKALQETFTLGKIKDGEDDEYDEYDEDDEYGIYYSLDHTGRTELLKVRLEMVNEFVMPATGLGEALGTTIKMMMDPREQDRPSAATVLDHLATAEAEHVAQVQAENVELRAETVELRAEAVELRAQNTELRAQIQP